jgi:hypothetical protein
MFSLPPATTTAPPTPFTESNQCLIKKLFIMSRTKIVCTNTDAALPFGDFEGGTLANVSEHKGQKDPNAKYVRFDVNKKKGRMANVAELMVLHNGEKSQALLQTEDGKPCGKVKDGDTAYVSETVAIKRETRLAFA